MLTPCNPLGSVWFRGSPGIGWDGLGIIVVWLTTAGGGSLRGICPSDWGAPPSHKIEGDRASPSGMSALLARKERGSALAHRQVRSDAAAYEKSYLPSAQHHRDILQHDGSDEGIQA